MNLSLFKMNPETSNNLNWFVFICICSYQKRNVHISTFLNEGC